MHEDKIRFRTGTCELQGLYHGGRTAKGVVVTHPHPLYGGNMFNPVVEAIAAAYFKRGFATLRFNFRGTGKSTGSYDNGIGEQADVAAAVAFLQNEGLREIHLSGYSFGAWVNATALQNALAVKALTMVAPPAAFIEFDKGIRLPMLSSVIAGSHDEIAPPALIRPLMDQWNLGARLDIIEGADHFFFGFLGEVTRNLLDVIPTDQPA